MSLKDSDDSGSWRIKDAKGVARCIWCGLKPNQRPRCGSGSDHWKFYWKRNKRRAIYQLTHEPEIKRDRRIKALRNRYGITPEQFDVMMEAQGYRCAICRERLDLPNAKGLPVWRVDHNHQTKAVRGILCNACNLMLGHAKDSELVLEMALAYLRNWDRMRIRKAER